MKRRFLKIQKEFFNFKEQILKDNKVDIWNNCNKIYFYFNIYEYFMYNEILDKEILARIEEHQNLIANLWNYYLKHEEIQITTWKDIDEFLEQYLELETHFIK